MSDARRVVITGVSKGLGLAMAEQFIELGHTVIGCARSADAVDITPPPPAEHRR